MLFLYVVQLGGCLITIQAHSPQLGQELCTFDASYIVHSHSALESLTSHKNTTKMVLRNSILRLSATLIAISALVVSSEVRNANLVPLPAPSGNVYKVGRSIAELVDCSRIQPFAPDVEHPRLMISVFYPVSSQEEPYLAEYMPSITALYEDNVYADLGIASPNGTFEKLALQLASHSANSQTNHFECTFPLILFMPGQGITRLFYSLIASTISSKGYTVVTIDAPYDVDIVQYLDDSTTFENDTVWNSSDLQSLVETATLAVDTRAQDARFVLTALQNATLAHEIIPNLPATGLNTSHVAMFGHSLGGATALAVTASDPRVVGGLNMDGAFFGPVAMQGTDKPFMILAVEGHTRNGSDFLYDGKGSWAEAWPHLTGWKRNMMVNDTLHYDFSDTPIVYETLGITPGKNTSLEVAIGGLGGKRALDITTSYVGAFLDFVMYGKCSPLLDGPVDDYPEVTFED
jgi:hypothetical protein